jgi:hypothetical protein
VNLRARMDAMEIHRGAQSVLGISVILKVKMKLNMKEKKLQQRMQQMNAYSGLLQGWVPGKKWTFQYMRETWMLKSF